MTRTDIILVDVSSCYMALGSQFSPPCDKFSERFLQIRDSLVRCKEGS